MNIRFLSILALLSLFASAAAQTVNFEFSDGIDNGPLKAKMERNISRLLSSINAANAAGSDINYTGIDINNDASASIGMTWNNIHFAIEDDDYVEHCVKVAGTNGGYRVQNIGVLINPLPESGYDGDMRREVYIDLDRNGNISDFNFTLGVNMYTEILKKGEEIGDLDRRLQIINWCEHFAKAYCDKNLGFMQTVFSDDAIIITGKMTMKRVPGDGGVRLRSKVEYTQQTKTQYLAKLKRIFAANKYVNVRFDDYSVVRHGSKPNYYGVTLKQSWHTPSYSDEGILFLIWDFTNEEQPRILVRTWQPMTEKAFRMGDFKLP